MPDENGNEFGFKVGPVEVKASGRYTVFIVIIFMGFVILGGLMYFHNSDMIVTHDEQTFFLSLPDSEKKEWRIKPPPSVSRKLINPSSANTNGGPP